jgi:peptidoglycan/xylan/chitin deacetylase (PgdA/CDA1 family)
LTFDDAYESFFQFAYPALRDYNLTFTLFPVVGFIGTWNRWEVNLGWRRFRHLRWEQLREMEGAEIGSHTQTHPCLTGLNETELRRELETSKKTLEDALGREVKYLSLPFGRFNQKVLETARNLGYSAVCTMEPGADRDGFLIGRYGVYLLDTRLDILSKLGRGGNPRWEKIKLQIINRLSAGTVMVKRWRKGR